MKLGILIYLKTLKSLNLNDNNLTGSIPDALTTLPQLQVLDVSNNNLSGPLPVFQSTVKFSSPGNLFLGKNITTGSEGNGGNGGPSGSGSNSTTLGGSPFGTSNGSSFVLAGMIAGVVIAVVVFVGVMLFQETTSEIWES
ncbi:Receptor-like kinase TMK4 [Camellia lanceoleosa]|uniref:Receptor-like kinase TMK4 n=1 Tax=Camellia lanceoleosa TaxID=1840588 RepID=A0ACC0FHD9_9ERIC|nr:Receptor-like kinase TMK4 [Camellia lanceoleosa]